MGLFLEMHNADYLRAPLGCYGSMLRADISFSRHLGDHGGRQVDDIGYVKTEPLFIWGSGHPEI